MLPNKTGKWIVNDKTLIDVFMNAYDGTLNFYLEDKHGQLWPIGVRYLHPRDKYEYVHTAPDLR